MIAVAFPGQGAQYVGMAGELDQMRLEYFARASDLLGYDLLELCQKAQSNNSPTPVTLSRRSWWLVSAIGQL